MGIRKLTVYSQGLVGGVGTSAKAIRQTNQVRHALSRVAMRIANTLPCGVNYYYFPNPSRILFTWKVKDRVSTFCHPNADLSLQVLFGDLVAIRVDRTAHYSLVSEEGKAEFDALIPHGGHTIVLHDPRSGKPVTYTVTLLHQLKCLGIIRGNYNSGEPPSQLTNDCMNYLRRSTLCNINTRIDHSVKPKGNAVRGYDAVCQDWTKLYDEVERIQKADVGAE